MAEEETVNVRAEKEVIERFANLGMGALPRPLNQAVEEIQQHAKERAKLNAPIDTGALRNSIDVDVTRSRGLIEFSYVANVDYVIKTHEEQYRLGPKSAAQPTTEEGGVGNKYFTRVVDKWGEHYMDLLVAAVMKSLQ